LLVAEMMSRTRTLLVGEPTGAPFALNIRLSPFSRPPSNANDKVTADLPIGLVIFEIEPAVGNARI
jgi:hypothetical protein